MSYTRDGQPIEEPCEVCSLMPENCACPVCPVCGVQGRPDCYKEGHLSSHYKPRIHKLKIWPPYWQHIQEGRKSFEFRFDDRGFWPGDIVQLQEWDPATKEYSGRFLVRKINYLIKNCEEFGIPTGYCIFQMEKV